MGKKEKQTSGKKNEGGGEDSKRDQKLQAILLADSFTKAFRPVTWEKPKVLLPLVNVPMLEYTIEFLAQNGVEELFVFCVWHAEMLQSYLINSKWSTILSIRCITSTSCLSAGDALRELDAMGVIRSDPFILISGDVISNMDLKKAIEFHKEKRKEDNNCIMTVVLKQVNKTNGAKPVLTDLVVGLDRMSSQILLFEDNYKNSSVNIPLEIMADHPGGLNFRSDLLDCHVDICSPEVMLQFSDNFDYQEIRRDFIRNEVVNWELGMHIYGYMLQNEYAARVHDLRTYHTICRDIVTRWVYPLVPDAQLLQDSSYTHSKRYIYKEKGCKVSRSARIGDGCVLGNACQIGDNAVLERAIVGRNSYVGSEAVVIESHLWEGSRVEDGAYINQAIICDQAVVKKGAHVGRGCVLSYGAVVGEGVVLPDFTRVSCLKNLQTGDDDDGDVSSKQLSKLTVESKYDTVVLGADGVGYVWSFQCYNDDEMPDEDEEEESRDCNGSVNVMKASSMGCTEEEIWKRSLWTNMPPPVEEEEDSSIDENEEDYKNNEDSNFDYIENEDALMSYGTGTPDESDEDFLNVISDMVTTGHLDGHLPDNLLMEIKGYKFAHNKSFSDCLRGCVPAVLSISITEGTKSNAIISTTKTTGAIQVSIVTYLKKFLTKNGWAFTILRALLQDTKDEVTLIEAVENFVLLEENSLTLFPVFRLILQLLYDEELITEDALLLWINVREEEGKDPSSNRGKLFQQPQVQSFVEWIKEDDEDDDEEDDEDEED